MNRPEVVSVAQARTLIATQSPTILDMRDHRSYRARHIVGAMLLHDGLEQALLADEERDKALLFYCYRGVKSREKAEFFAGMGFSRVYSLDNGFAAWPRDDDSTTG